MLLTSSWTIDILLLFTTLIFPIYKYVTRNFDYWKKKGVYYVKPVPFFGSAYDMATFKVQVGIWFRDLYNTIKQPFYGLYMFDEPFLVVQCPELIKRILVKDFSYFMDRTVLAPQHDQLVANMLFVQKSPEWKTLRNKMSPVFTSGKLKNMFGIMSNVGMDMKSYVRRNLGKLEGKELCAKYSTDIIAICAFAIKANSFQNEDADFRKVGRLMFDFRWKTAICQTGYFFFQKWAQFWRLNFFDPWVNDFLKTVFWKTINIREESHIKGNDLIDIIINMRKNNELCREINFEGDKVVAQAVQFFAAGFETSSSTIAYTLYEMSIHPEIQDKLRAEIINNIKENNGLTYEGVMNLKYLDMCVMETLRMYPVLPFLDRRCNADYKIPGTDITIDKGTPVYIPMVGLHYDENYFPDPYVYKPERFSDKNSYNLNGIYYMPFGEGPRICLGERFGMLSSKLGIIHILSEFIVEKLPETPEPLEFEPKSFLLQSKVGLPMRFKEFVANPA